jgi:hypothetical protein
MASYKDNFLSCFNHCMKFPDNNFLYLWMISEKTKPHGMMTWTVDSLMLSGYGTGNAFIFSLTSLKLQLYLRA